MRHSDSGVAYDLLGMLMHYAPNSEAQGRLSAQYNRLQSAGLSAREIGAVLSKMLHEGLAHNDWPWGASPPPPPMGPIIQDHGRPGSQV